MHAAGCADDYFRTEAKVAENGILYLIHVKMLQTGAVKPEPKSKTSTTDDEHPSMAFGYPLPSLPARRKTQASYFISIFLAEIS